MAPRVFTIPPSAPFLRVLIKALVSGDLVQGFAPGTDPAKLAAATLYLPTRRACRLARDSFLDVLGTDAAVLPRMVPIGDIDEDELAFADAGGAAALDLPPALGGLARRMMLARLVLAWAKRLVPDDGQPLVVGTPALALGLADDLARLMDDMATREVDWARLDTLAPEGADKYWQLTLQFLAIARTQWPEILRKHGAIEPAERRDRLINAEAARLKTLGDGPVIAAGSTGSMPATAKLLATIAHLPHGAVVLPGLDMDLDEASWTTIAGDDRNEPAAGHPQFAMRGLLERIGMSRREVVTLAPPAPHGREALMSEAMRPAATTDQWRTRLDAAGFSAKLDAGLTGVTVIEAVNAEDEALAIAVALREAVETPDKTAALVTPDRALARRVVAALGRWNVAVDDSGGDRLADTSAGIFARLTAGLALGGLAPVDLLAVLKHPLTRLGRAAGGWAYAVSALECAVLRGTRPRAGSAALAHALQTVGTELKKLRAGERSDIHPADPRATLTDSEVAAAAELVAALTVALAPLEALAGAHSVSFCAIAAAHRKAIAALSGDARETVAAFDGTDGVALALAFDDIAKQGDNDLPLSAADYGDMFAAAISDLVVRRPGAPRARVRIYGPLEARLAEVHRIVLGGLAEGIWPPETRTDPWLNRPMRHQLGLDLPERRIGLSAHDFAQLIGAPEAFLTRPAKVGGAPAVASRFLQRLAAVAGESRWNAARGRGQIYLDLARGLDHCAQAHPCKAPAPKPPRAARPVSLSVTEIEHWLRDPYTIFAKHILKLTPLDPVDMPLGAADRGSAIHDAIGEFSQTHADALPPDPLAELMTIGRARFAPLDDYPEARALWWPRFRRIAGWFVDWERERRVDLAQIRAEIRGEIDIPLGERTFRLRGRADRIERLKDGGYAILDFKTGTTPSAKQVRIGVSPQLTLEAAMLRHGGFADVAPGASVAQFVYVTLKGGDPAGDTDIVNLKDRSPDEAADYAYARLKELATKFEEEAQPYTSMVLSMWSNRYGAYDDLARVKEWSASGAGGEE